MLVISNTRYVPLRSGYIVLQDANEAYYYVHKTLYDQAVILTDRYANNIQVLQDQIGGNPEWNCITLFVENAPKPINILGYFLALMDRDIEYWGDVVGALDLIASAVHLRNFIKQPQEIRQSVQFSLTLQEEYVDSWELFFNTQCCEYDSIREVMLGGGGTVSHAPVQKRSSHASVVEDDDDEDDEDEEDDDDEFDLEALLAMGPELLEQAEAEAMQELQNNKAKEEEKVEEEKAAPSSTEGGSGLDVIKRRRKSL